MTVAFVVGCPTVVAILFFVCIVVIVVVVFAFVFLNYDEWIIYL